MPCTRIRAQHRLTEVLWPVGRVEHVGGVDLGLIAERPRVAPLLDHRREGGDDLPEFLGLGGVRFRIATRSLARRAGAILPRPGVRSFI